MKTNATQIGIGATAVIWCVLRICVAGGLASDSTSVLASVPSSGAYKAQSASQLPASPDVAGMPVCDPNWDVVPNPNTSRYESHLFGVAAVTSTDVWAAGDYVNGSGSIQTLIEHWDGVAWRIVPSPSYAHQSSILAGIAAVSSTDVWAVGSNSGGLAQTLIEHWDGSQWSVVPSPNAGTDGSRLMGIAAVSSTDIWAVGSSFFGLNLMQTLVEHWDGQQWSIVSSPNPDTGQYNYNQLNGVSAVSPTDVWAVGYYGNATTDETLVEHWNGSRWDVVSSPNRNTQRNELNGVFAISTSDVWAVGDYVNGSVQQTLVEHWNGSRWDVVSSPNPDTGQYNQLYGVSAVSPTDVWAVGYYYTGTLMVETLIEHWNGQQWSTVSSPNSDAGHANYLYDVAALSASEVWTVGDYGNGAVNQTLVEHWDGGAWTILPSPSAGTTANLLDGVATISSTDVWAVGYYYNGSAYRTLAEEWDGSQWIPVPTLNLGPTDNLLTGVAAISPTDVWAVGYYSNGAVNQTLVEHWDGSQWSIEASPNPGTGDSVLTRVAALSPTDVWAVGYFNDGFASKTLVEHLENGVWITKSSPNHGTGNNYLKGVAAISSTDVWAVGYYSNGAVNQTLVEHWDGSQWSAVPSPNLGSNDNFLEGVAAISSTDVWAVGFYSNGAVNQTLVEHWDGSQWNVYGSPDGGTGGNSLLGVTAISSTDVWAVGNYSIDGDSAAQTLIEHWDGSRWDIVPSANNGTGGSSLLGVGAPSPTDVWAVGYYSNGTVNQTLVEHYNPCPITATPASTSTLVPPAATSTSTGTTVPPTSTPTSTPTLTLTPTQVPQGCAAGFWQGGLGGRLWNQPNDPDWTSHGGVGTNPYVTVTQFNSYFAPYVGFGLNTMEQMLSGGGSNTAHKAARDVVAGYLNASFGLNYPYTRLQIADMWSNAISSGDFRSVYNLLDPANAQLCPVR